LALVYLGLRHPTTVALAEAVDDPAAAPRALAVLDAELVRVVDDDYRRASARAGGAVPDEE